MAENKKIGKYDFIEYFDDANVYKVSVNNIYKLINADGEVLLEAEYISDPILICNKYFQVVFKDSNWKYGLAYVNSYVIVKPKYDYMKYFGRSRYHVTVGGNIGIVTATGEELISPK